MGSAFWYYSFWKSGGFKKYDMKLSLFLKDKCLVKVVKKCFFEKDKCLVALIKFVDWGVDYHKGQYINIHTHTLLIIGFLICFPIFCILKFPHTNS